MNEKQEILNELRLAHEGAPWHGPSRAAVLADVTMDEAARRPGVEGHSIWELVLHMYAWTREVARRVREGTAADPKEGDYPPVGTPSTDAWRAAVASLSVAHADVIDAVTSLNEARLDERVGGSDGGATLRVTLHGLAQHDAYHTGQIAILKKIYRGGAGRAPERSGQR